MSEDATLEHEGAPGMDAPPEGQEPATTIPNDPPADGVAVEEAAQDPPKSKRELAMEAIEAKRNQEFEKESGLRIGGPDAAASEGGHAGPGATEVAAGQEEREGQARRVKVEGEELEVTDDEIRQYQKGLTADRRLEQAAEERKRNETESARLAAERAELERIRAGGAAGKAAGSGDEDSQATPIGDDVDGGARKLYEDLTSGDEDAAIAAIAKLQGRQPEAIPTEQIAARVRQEIAWQDAKTAFATGYKDIVDDPLLRQIASNTLTETLKTSKSYDQAFREAGDRTRAWVRKLNGGSTQDGGGEPPADPGRAEKQLRKERIDQPTAINARAAGKPQEEVAKPSTIIKEMREGRGQAA